MPDAYRDGDNWVISDRSGRKVRASETRVEWNGSRVHESEFEPRQSQDFVRGLRDDMAAKNPRLRPTDTFVGPLTTLVAAASVAGDVTVTVESSARMEPGDKVLIYLDSTDTFRGVIQTVPNATSFTLTLPLSGAISVGNAVIDTSAVSTTDLDP